LEKKLLAMYDKYMAPIFSKFNVKIRYGLQAIPSIHLYSDMVNEPEELGSISYIYIFSAVALFMLIIACINYMNLTTARSARRAREIGIRKVTGCSRYQLVAQFLAESTLTAFVALLLSIGLIAIFLSTFNSLSGKFITFGSLLDGGTIMIRPGSGFVRGLAGGQLSLHSICLTLTR
jgi:putative ABC transport system permease protein